MLSPSTRHSPSFSQSGAFLDAHPGTHRLPSGSHKQSSSPLHADSCNVSQFRTHVSPFMWHSPSSLHSDAVLGEQPTMHFLPSGTHRQSPSPMHGSSWRGSQFRAHVSPFMWHSSSESQSAAALGEQAMTHFRLSGVHRHPLSSLHRDS